MAKATWTVTGDKKLVQQFHALDKKSQRRALERSLVAAGLLLANDMKIKAPYLTGNLKRSLHVGGYGESAGLESPTTGTDIGGNESGKDYAEVSVGTNVEYAKYVEAKKPFMRPATDATRNDIPGEIAAALRDLLRSAG